MKKISVLTNKKKYPIYIGDSLIKKIDKILIKERLFSNNCLIIYDSKVVGDNLKIIKNKIPYKKKFYLKFVASEENKNLEFVNKIIEILLKNNLLNAIMKRSFNFGLNKIADAFEKRALEIYNLN